MDLGQGFPARHLLDFSKAFDTVPHGRLLAKLQYYKINNFVWKWIQSWLTQRTQSVVVDGASSKPTSVLSGVLQGTVLGPLMFLLYINDITDKVSSTLCLFADDCILYRKIKSPENSISLQKDLDLLSHWASTWKINLNTFKCVVLRCSRSSMPILYNYRLNDHILDIREEHPYLGIILHKSLSWSSHISKISTKASQTFNFLRRNLSKYSPPIKASAYLTLVHPIMEYAAVAWDPYQQNNINALEKIQRRAARWVMNDYGRYNSVSNLLHDLNWQPLQVRRNFKYFIKQYTT